MTEHGLVESVQRTVDTRIVLNDDGEIEREEIENASAPNDPYLAEYFCDCGEGFEDWNEAKQHVLDARAES